MLSAKTPDPSTKPEPNPAPPRGPGDPLVQLQAALAVIPELDNAMRRLALDNGELRLRLVDKQKEIDELQRGFDSEVEQHRTTNEERKAALDRNVTLSAELTTAHAELAEAGTSLRELQRNALPSNCTRCNGSGAEPPGCPESGPCERCGGWTTHKRVIAGHHLTEPAPADKPSEPPKVSETERVIDERIEKFLVERLALRIDKGLLRLALRDRRGRDFEDSFGSVPLRNLIEGQR